MPLSSDPSVTYNSQGNVVAAGTALAANTTTTGVTVDASANSLGTWLSATVTFTSVSATAGVTVSIYPAGDATPHFDTTATWQFTVPATGSSTQQTSLFVPTGKYQVKLTNIDATYSVTYGLTSNPVA